ncbi:MAG: tRNA (guanosine(46)-N7)-methyltransferase TrmB [Lachnospiraceae bacterium]|nr:tRNA (guanosine(46)-N7)-methyltransferase TrmB [Lachnospiraceae bacterium]
MRLRNIPGAKEAVNESPYCFTEFKEPDRPWREIFGNDHPIFMEIGMGKGRFIIDNAIRYPDINFIGVERYESVIYKALGKLKRMGETAPLNLKFIRMDATEIEKYFPDSQTVDKIYLNFSDPWPKDRHAKRRLESKEFLARYDKILSPSGDIEFKTDNESLFDFALSEVESSKWELSYCTRDLHADAEEMKDNIMTEYEEKFSAKGQKIYKYIIYR